MQGDTSALELAAAEMASAAALLVQMEREIMGITQAGVSPSQRSKLVLQPELNPRGGLASLLRFVVCHRYISELLIGEDGRLQRGYATNFELTLAGYNQNAFELCMKALVSTR